MSDNKEEWIAKKSDGIEGASISLCPPSFLIQNSPAQSVRLTSSHSFFAASPAEILSFQSIRNIGIKNAQSSLESSTLHKYFSIITLSNGHIFRLCFLM